MPIQTPANTTGDQPVVDLPPIVLMADPLRPAQGTKPPGPDHLGPLLMAPAAVRPRDQVDAQEARP